MACNDFRAKARHKITIESKSLTTDRYGGQLVTWTTQSTVFAKIEPYSGREPLANEQLQSRVSHKMTIRYQSTLKDTASASSNRVLFDDRVFSIEHIRNLHDDMKNEGKAYQVLYVVENGAENA